MAKVIVNVDQDCDGCGGCVISCPGEVLEIIDGNATALHVEDCRACLWIEKKRRLKLNSNPARRD